MAILDDLYLSRYDRKTYNCAHFAGEVWRRLTGDSCIAQVAEVYTHGKLPPYKQFRRMVRGFKQVDNRSPLAIVLCEPPFDDLHIGVLQDGHLIHLTPSGVECFELSVYEKLYHNMRFYR